MSLPDDGPFALWMWLPGIRHWMQVGGGTEMQMRHARLVALAVTAAFHQRTTTFLVAPALPVPTDAPVGPTVAVHLPAPQRVSYSSSGPTGPTPADVWRPAAGEAWEVERDRDGDVHVFLSDITDDGGRDEWRELALALLAATEPTADPS